MKRKVIIKNLFWVFPLLLLMSISLILMYHAQFITEIYANHFTKQCLWFGIGILLLIFSFLIQPQKLFRFSFLLYLINILLLVLVLFIGKDANGSKAWFDLKYFTFQPSEFMKLSYTLFLAHFIARQKPKKWFEELKFLFVVFIIYLVPSILVFLEPDTGAILFFTIITFAILAFSFLRKRWLVFLSFLFLAFIAAFFYCYFFQKDFLIQLIGTTFFYRVDRLLNFRSGMQIENAMIAIGSAPFFRFSFIETGIYIPEAPTDFAFALTSNVLGIFGNVLILLAFFIFDLALISICKKMPKGEERLFTIAFSWMFITSQIINISMNLGLFPIIGIPLPFVSYGGSSTIVLFLFLAILLSFQRKRSRKKRE